MDRKTFLLLVVKLIETRPDMDIITVAEEAGWLAKMVGHYENDPRCCDCGAVVENTPHDTDCAGWG